MSRIKLSVVAAIILATTQTIQAQSQVGDGGAEMGVSTLGFYVSSDYTFAENIAVRVPVYFAGYEGEFDLDGNTMDTDLGILSLSAMVDFYLPDTGLRMSTGLSFGGYTLSSNVDEVEFDGETYTADFEFEAKQISDIAPTIAIGYSKIFNDQWGLSTELGARIATMELTVSGDETLSPTERDDFNENIDDFNDELEEFGIIPFLSFGANYRF